MHRALKHLALLAIIVSCTGCNWAFGVALGLQCALILPRSEEIQTPASWNNYHLLEAAEATFRQNNLNAAGCSNATKECLEQQSQAGWWNSSTVTLRNSTDGILEINDYTRSEAVGYSARIERLDNDGRVRISVYGVMPYCGEADSNTELKRIATMFKRTTIVLGTGEHKAFKERVEAALKAL